MGRRISTSVRVEGRATGMLLLTKKEAFPFSLLPYFCRSVGKI